MDKKKISLYLDYLAVAILILTIGSAVAVSGYVIITEFPLWGILFAVIIWAASRIARRPIP